MPPDAADATVPSGPRAGPPRGTFWPGVGIPPGMRYDKHDDFHLARGRHVPTAATVALAMAGLPDRAHAAVTGWRDAWLRSGIDPEGFAASLGQVEPDDWLADFERGNLAAAADEARKGRRCDAAQILVQMSVALGHGRVRPSAFHILEDATLTLAMGEANAPLRLAYGSGHDKARFLGVGRGPEGAILAVLSGTNEDTSRERLLWQFGAVNPDWASPGFRHAARRVVGVRTNHPTVVAALADMADAGYSRAFVKSAVCKRGTWTVDLDGVTDVAGASARLVGAMGLTMQDLFRPAPHGTFLIQEHLPFTHEHRFLVVGHRVVASTPSARCLSLADCRGRLLDPRVARLRRPEGPNGPFDRGEADVVEDRTMVAAMAWAARDLARALREEGRFRGNYVLDMGMTARGVAAVEVNGLTNAGLYAVDVGRLARALARWHDEPARRATPHVDEEPVASGVMERVYDSVGMGERKGPAGRVARALWRLVAKPTVARDRQERHPDDDPERRDVDAMLAMLVQFAGFREEAEKALAREGKGD